MRSLAQHPVRWALAAVVAGVLVGGSIFSFVEDGASMPDGWWWAFVSMSTVGYGDISPKTTEVRFLATFVILTGIAATAILTAALAGRITIARIEAAEPQDLHGDFDQLVTLAESLRTRYQYDEEHDDKLLRQATRLLTAYDDHHDSNGDYHAEMGRLRAVLTSHPEVRSTT